MDADTKFRLSVVTVSAIVFVAAFGIVFYFDPMCHDDLVSTVPSPNHKMVASVFVRDCGAMAHEATQVVVHKPAKNYSRGDFAAAVDREPPIQLMWISDSELVVHCRCDVGRINFKQEVDGIKISVKAD